MYDIPEMLQLAALMDGMPEGEERRALNAMLKGRRPLPPAVLTFLRTNQLKPNDIYRRRMGRELFGLAPTELDVGIDAGRIPRPIKIGLRATGWMGWQVAAHQLKLIVAAELERAGVAA